MRSRLPWAESRDFEWLLFVSRMVPLGMNPVKAGLQYLGAALTGSTVAFLATGLICYVIFPHDGPVGEGFVMLLIYLFSCCLCVPCYVVLMTLHRQGRRDTRQMIACEVILRASVIVAACLLSFMLVKLPTAMITKWLACLVGVFACAWAIKPSLWEQRRTRTGAAT
jgi:hypothetical protein